MHVVIAKVDEVFFDGEAKSLTVPAAEGEMTVLPRHMPLITTLRPGIITVRDQNESKQFPIGSGILDIRHQGVTILL